MRQSGVLDTLGGRALVGTFSAILLGILISLLMRMKEEDEALGRVFGQEWKQWARKVPYSIVPGIY
jgi:protein-S-isoprenylcysteine O-methyltransferase Ste14